MQLSVPPAIILGLSETGLAVARSLFARGIVTIGIDYRFSPSARSRCFARIKILVDSDYRMLLDTLFEIKEEFGVMPVLFATNDYYLHFVFSNLEALKEIVHFAKNRKKTLKTILDKWLFYKFCCERNLPVPKTFRICSYEDLLTAAEEFSFPFIIKPRYPYLVRLPQINKARVINSLLELWSLKNVDFSSNGVIAQEMISGADDLQHYSFASIVLRNGRIAGSLTAQKIRQSPPNHGVGTLVRSTDNEYVRKLSERLISALNYKGVSEIEFKYDPVIEEYKIIEMNARFWSQTALAIAYGLDFPGMYFDDSTNIAITTPCLHARSGVYWINLIDDCYCCFHPRDGYFRPIRFSVFRWLLDVIKVRAFAYLSLRDPYPFLALLKETFFKKRP